VACRQSKNYSEALARLDRLEGHPTFYHRKLISVEDEYVWFYEAPERYADRPALPGGIWMPEERRHEIAVPMQIDPVTDKAIRRTQSALKIVSLPIQLTYRTSGPDIKLSVNDQFEAFVEWGEEIVSQGWVERPARVYRLFHELVEPATRDEPENVDYVEVENGFSNLGSAVARYIRMLADVVSEEFGYIVEAEETPEGDFWDAEFDAFYEIESGSCSLDEYERNCERLLAAVKRFQNVYEPLTVRQAAKNLRLRQSDVIDMADDLGLNVNVAVGIPGLGTSDELPQGQWTLEYLGGRE